jgi:hypothetical protein
MYLKLFTPVLLFLILSTPAYCQDDAVKPDVERQADSILKQFFNESGADPRFEEGIDSARLEEAENDYMANFIKLQRDPKKELLRKRLLQGFIGLVLLIGLIVVLRKKNRKYRGDNYSSRS